MKWCWKVALPLVLLMYSHSQADSVVQSSLIPSDAMFPLGANLVTHAHQQERATALLNVAQTLEQALEKKESQDATRKKKHPKHSESKETAAEHNKSKNYEAQLSAALTEFLRDPAFATSMSLHTKKIAIRDLLPVLAKQGHVSLLIDNDVTGFVSKINTDEASIGALMQMVLDTPTQPLALIRVPGGWRVMQRSKALDILKPIILGGDSADRVVEKISLAHAVWNDRLKNSLTALWQGIVGNAKDTHESYLVIDDDAGLILCCGRTEQVKKFKSLVAALDKAAPQVRLEMRVISAGKNFDSEFGLEWSGQYDRRAWANSLGFAGVGLGAIQQPSTAASDVKPVDQPLDALKNMVGWVLNAIPISLSNKSAAATAMSLPITFGGKHLEWGRLNLRLAAAEQNKEIKTILKPVLLVNNLETAEILVGQQLPHKVKMEESVQGSLLNASSTSYKDVGTKIQVKPVAVGTSGQVSLDVFLEHSYITNQQQTGLLNDDRGTYHYSIETAQTRNKIVLKSGQTTMIGGLMVNAHEQVESGIPILKDIPFLGALFRGKSKVMVEKQLLIFITPTLVQCGEESTVVGATAIAA
jgi:type IV pilus assembly protein PilQ